MRCSKCGHDNPPETLFCEDCDWRLDVPYRAPKKRNPVTFACAAAAVGAVAAVLSLFIPGAEMAGLALGAVGVILGSYSVNIPRYVQTDKRSLCIGLSGAGLVLSMVGFIIGLAGVVG